MMTTKTGGLLSRMKGARAAKRAQLVAWSTHLAGPDGPLSAGFIKISAGSGTLTEFTIYPAPAETETGAQVRVETSTFDVRWISDAPVSIQGRATTGSRWRDRSKRFYFFLGWDPRGDLNQDGFIVEANETFTEFGTEGGMWSVTLSRSE